MAGLERRTTLRPSHDTDAPFAERARGRARPPRAVFGAVRPSLIRARPAGTARAKGPAARSRRLYGELLRHAPALRGQEARRAREPAVLPGLTARLSWPRCGRGHSWASAPSRRWP